MCAHLPHKDPRVIWHIEALADAYAVDVAAINIGNEPRQQECRFVRHCHVAPYAPVTRSVRATAQGMFDTYGAYALPLAVPMGIGLLASLFAAAARLVLRILRRAVKLWRAALQRRRPIRFTHPVDGDQERRLQPSGLLVRLRSKLANVLEEAPREGAESVSDRIAFEVAWMVVAARTFLLYLPAVTRSLMAVEASRQPYDLIVANDLETLAAAVRYKKRNGGTVVYDAHENWGYVRPRTPAWYGRIVQWHERRLARYAAVVTTVSPLLVEHLRISLGHNKVMLLPNAGPVPRPALVADLTREEKYRAELEQVSEGRMIFLFQGGIAPQRGLAELVAAWAYVPADMAVLVIRAPTAESRESQRVLRMCDEMGLLGKSVFRLSSLPEEDLIVAAMGADVGVIPYRPVFANHIMCCPNKLSQYMQAGLAILANDIPYVRSIVETAECGMVYSDERGPANTALQVMAMCSDREQTKRLGENGKQFVATSYNWTSFYSGVREEVRRVEGAGRKRSVSGVADCGTV
jgi:glycosyltransferase involved in cell wall biosynthesis